MEKTFSCKLMTHRNFDGVHLPSSASGLQRHPEQIHDHFDKTPDAQFQINSNLTVSLVADDLLNCDPHFYQRASYLRSSVVVAGSGCGSDPQAKDTLLGEACKGVKAVVAKSYTVAFKQQLVESGILPLEFIHPEDYDKISLYDTLYLEQLEAALKPNTWMIYNRSTEEFYEATFPSLQGSNSHKASEMTLAIAR